MKTRAGKIVWVVQDCTDWEKDLLGIFSTEVLAADAVKTLRPDVVFRILSVELDAPLDP